MKTRRKISPLTEKEFKELIEGRKIFAISLLNMHLSHGEHLSHFLRKVDSIHFPFRLFYITKSKELIIQDVKMMAKGDCAKNTSIEDFPLNKFIECELGDPAIMDLKFIGGFQNLYVFQTRSENFIVSMNEGENTNCIAPTKN